MYTEKRQHYRVNTFIPVEMTVEDDLRSLTDYFGRIRREINHTFAEIAEEITPFYGYVQDLSETGLRVISLDSFLPGTKLFLKLLLHGYELQPLPASLIYSNVNGGLYYYGICFRSLGEDEHAVIKRVIKSLIPKQEQTKFPICHNILH